MCAVFISGVRCVLVLLYRLWLVCGLSVACLWALAAAEHVVARGEEHLIWTVHRSGRGRRGFSGRGCEKEGKAGRGEKWEVKEPGTGRGRTDGHATWGWGVCSVDNILYNVHICRPKHRRGRRPVVSARKTAAALRQVVVVLAGGGGSWGKPSSQVSWQTAIGEQATGVQWPLAHVM